MSIFGFLFAEPYDDRRIDSYDQGVLYISTCKVPDGRKLYETGLTHPEYNQGNFVIVACYDTPEEARVGHAKWVNIMTQETLPDHLLDIANAEIQLGIQRIYPREEVS